MTGLTFDQQLCLMLIDKAVIGGFLALAAFAFGRLLEAFKAAQSRDLEAFKLVQSRELEAFRHSLASEAESERTLRLAVAEVAKRLAAGSHIICWLCWVAKHSPGDLRPENLESYDQEMHSLLSELVSARVVLAALSPEAHDELSSIIDQLYGLDVDVGEAKALYLRSPEAGVKKLAALHETSGSFDDELLDRVTKLQALRKVARPAQSTVAAVGPLGGAPLKHR